MKTRPSGIPLWMMTAICTSATIVGCGTSPPRTDAEKRTQGDALLLRMSHQLANAQSISFTTSETDERVRPSGKVVIQLTREVKLRRPDKLWFKATGGADLEGFYQGKDLTLLSHKDKVWGLMPMPSTIDETVIAVEDKYGIPMPVGDLLTKNPSEVLLSSQTTGGWMREETIGGKNCAVLAWKHPNVEWSVWIPTSGEPLPARLDIAYLKKKQQPKSSIVFSNWNLSATLPDATFVAQVPNDFEGIPVIQRASAVIPNLPPDTSEPAGAKKGKGK